MHFRHANEHKSAEKPSPTSLFNLSTLLTGLSVDRITDRIIGWVLPEHPSREDVQRVI